MILCKKLLPLSVLFAILLFLVACGNENEAIAGDDSIADNPREHTAEDYLPISEGFEDYSVWMDVSIWKNGDGGVIRTSEIESVFVFDNGEVTRYGSPDNSSELSNELTMEDVHDLSDKEIIKLVSKYVEPESLGEYTLDIRLDGSGNYTEEMEFILPDDTILFMGELVKNTIYETTYAGLVSDRNSQNSLQNNLITKVDESFVGFNLDGPDTNSKSVTIEGK